MSAPAVEMTLKERLAGEIPAALKRGDKVRLGALRLLSAAIKNREVEVGHSLSDEEFVEVATREAKRRREAIQAYEDAGRPDRAKLEREEQQVLESYLPQRLSDDEVDRLLEEALAATAASGPGDLGKVMGYIMGKARGRVDGRSIQARVRQRLEQ